LAKHDSRVVSIVDLDASLHRSQGWILDVIGASILAPGGGAHLGLS